VFENRSKEIDYSSLKALCFIGSYQRRLPVNLLRMLENAYDWEHLPFVHASSFRSIDLAEEGNWGWRAVATLPDGSLQHLELLVDEPNHYWATTVLSGDAKGFQIHTKAVSVSKQEIDVTVSFYLPKGFTKVLTGLNFSKAILPFELYKKIARRLGIKRVSPEEAPAQSILSALNYQYGILYDEDESLMSGRQRAIDRLKQNASMVGPENVLLGPVEDVRRDLPKVVQFGKHRFVVNQWRAEWRVYAAECPHLLGPLEKSAIDDQGRVVCPWHGYQFDITTGKNCTGNAIDLPTPPTISIIDDQLVLTAN